MEDVLPIYRRKTFSTCFCWKRPLMTRRPAPSTLPVVPISAKRNWMTCSGYVIRVPGVSDVRDERDKIRLEGGRT